MKQTVVGYEADPARIPTGKASFVMLKSRHVPSAVDNEEPVKRNK